MKRSDKENVIQEFPHWNTEEANAILAAIVLSSEDAIISKTLTGIVTSWNPGAEKIFGYSAAEMIGQPITKIIPPDRLKEEPEILSRLQRGEIVDHFETKRLNKNGKLLDVSLTISPVKDKWGNIIGASKIARDVTEAKHAEAELKESENLFHTLAETLPQMIWTRNVQGKIEFASKNWELYSGKKDISEAWKAMVHPDDWETVMNNWLKDSAGGHPFRYEVRLRNKEGDYYWHSAVGEPVKDDEGNIVKWIGALTNIHQQKTFSDNLEKEVAARTQELTVANRELKKSQEHFALLFNISPVASALITTEDGTVVNVNPAWERLFGKKREEIIGKKNSLQEEHIKPEERAALFQEIAAHGGTIQDKEMKVDFGNGKILYILLSVVTIELHGIKYFHSTYADITARKEAEQKMEAANLELQQKNKELESFTYISSHDLQEPLRKIQTFASLILENENANLSDEGKALFHRMTKTSDRMRTLLQDLLTFSHLNTADRKFEITDLHKILEEVKEECEDSIKEKNAIIEAGPMTSLKAMPFQFHRLLSNLLGNSLKFSKPGVPPRITIHTEILTAYKFHSGAVGRCCHITFADNGIGFAQKYSKKIFEVFQKLHVKEDYPGTGIGLAIVKKIVENHYGEITARSEPGKGTTFDIYLPAQEK